MDQGTIMKSIRLNYLKGIEWRNFSTRKAFIDWAKDPSHDGTYYVSTTQMTNKYTRKEILEACNAKQTK